PVLYPLSLHDALPIWLRAGQRVFDQTGGLHAAGLFDLEGQLRILREDVGRHNAVDKVVGRALLHGLLPAAGYLLAVSGRAGYEIDRKSTRLNSSHLVI